MTNNDLASTIASRRSIKPKFQTLPAPSDEVLEQAARAARAAPSHSTEFPVRFVKINSREKLARLFETALGPDADESSRERARSKAFKGACSIALIGRKAGPEDKELARKEALMTAGGALTNFLNVLWAEGFAAFTVSTRKIIDPEGLYDAQTEEVLCFVLCGTPTQELTPREPQASILSSW